MSHSLVEQLRSALDKAPVDAEGLVRFAGDFSLLKPADPGRGNRRIFFDYGNRGNKRMLQFFNDAPASNDPRTLAHAGNGFLMRRGYAVAWLAWQGDLLPGNGRMVLDLPVAPVTGLVRVEYIDDRPGITTLPLSGHASTRSHPTVSLDPREATRDPLMRGRISSRDLRQRVGSSLLVHDGLLQCVADDRPDVAWPVLATNGVVASHMRMRAHQT